MIPRYTDEIADEYVAVLQALGPATPSEVARRLRVSECCAVYWLAELARQGRLRMLAVAAVSPDEKPCAPESLRGCPHKPACPALANRGPLSPSAELGSVMPDAYGPGEQEGETQPPIGVAGWRALTGAGGGR